MAHFRNIVLTTVTIFTFLCSVSSWASNVVSYGDGSSSLDETTRLLWLDMTQTTNRSYLDVSANFGSGGDFEGYRYATAYEVLSFWEHAGITGGGTTIACAGPDCIYAERAAAGPVIDLVALLGGNTWATSYGFGGVIGLSSTPSEACGSGCSYSAFMVPELRVFYEYNNPAFFGLADALVVEGLRDYISDPSYASWLVSTAPVPTPEPATMLLFGLGLVGLAGIRRKL